MSYLAEPNLDYESYADSYNSSKGIDLIGDEFKPKQNGLNGHTNYDLKDLDTNDHHHIHNSSLNHTPTSLSDMQAINVTGATAPTTNLGPNMVLVNSAGGTTQTAVPIQQIIQQAQQQQQLQQLTPAGNLVSVALGPQQQQQVVYSAAPMTSLPTFTFSPHPPASVVSSSPGGSVSAGGQVFSVIQPQQAGVATTLDTSAVNPQQIAGTTTAGGATVQLLDLPSATGTTATATAGTTQAGNPEESGVLLCNLDELSRYIPENFYSDFAISDGSGGQGSGKGGVPDYLETVVAGKGITSTTVSAQPTQLQPNSLQPAVTGAGAVQQPQTVIQPAFSMAGTSIQQPQLITSPTAGSNTVVSGATGNCATTPQQLTIQLPTQPQPIQGVKTVTYVNPVLSTPATRPTQIQTSPTVTAASTTLQPVKMTAPTFAYTPSGERIQIQSLPDAKTATTAATPQQLQFQVKPQAAAGAPAGAQQTFQLQGLTIDPSKLTVMQELPEVGKVVVQEARPRNDSISTILEEMRGEEAGTYGGVEYTTAIPVAVSSVSNDPKKTTIKRVAAPASTVILPSNRNIITLPQGAIPIKINGLSALQLPPGASVKGLTPVNPGQTINLTNLAAPCTNAATTILTSPPLPAGTTATAAKKTKVEGVKANLPQTPLPPNLIATASKVVTTNNNSVVKSDSLSSPRASGGLNNNSCSPQQQLSSKTVGNNKTCNWVFENGEICGKTFSKSYNLVVHMRMHEDVRPFCCSLCDQTFRQKAHLQRHETTHGIGVKVGRSSGSGSGSAKTRKRKRSRSGAAPAAAASQAAIAASASPVLTTSSMALPDHLQKRLAHVSEKFGNPIPTATTVVTSAEGIPAIVTEGGVTKLVDVNGAIVKSKQSVTVLDNSGLAAAGDPNAEAMETEEMINSSYVEVNDEVANLKEEDMIEQAEDLTPEAGAAVAAGVVAAAPAKTILSVLLEGGQQAPTQPEGVKVEITSAPTTISPDMITAISGGKVTPDGGQVLQAGAPTVVTADGQGLLEAAAAASAELQDEVTENS